MPTHEIRALTGLRGVAAMVIVAFHVLRPQFHVHNFALRLLDHGYLSVDLFFVLSGFVLGLQHEPHKGRNAVMCHLRFMQRRFARIWPLYALTSVFLWSAFLFGWTWWQPIYHHPVRTLAISLTLLQCLGLAININPPAWSVSTEWIGYLIFPLLAGLAFHIRKLWPLLLLVSAVAGLAYLCFGTGPVPAWQLGRLNVSDPFSVQPVLRSLCGFTLGLLTCRIARQAQVVLPQPWLGTALGAAAIFLASVPNAELFTVLMFPPLILALTSRRDLLARVLAWPALHFLGLISYSIYLVHIPLSSLNAVSATQAWLYAHWPGIIPVSADDAVRVLTMSEIILVAAILHVCVEKPARNWLSPQISRTSAHQLRRVIHNSVHNSTSI